MNCPQRTQPMATKSETRPCALCQDEKDLRNSHIASKFLWRRSGVTGGNRFSIACLTDPSLNQPHQQDGIKEYLLCADCEQQFNRYETYVAKVLFGPASPILKREPTHCVGTGFQYRELKLFQMSILWRMGISSHPFYSHVELGKHEEILRKMLLDEDAGEPWQYGCITTLLDHQREPLIGIFSQPSLTKRFGHYAYEYTLGGGIHWIQFVTSHPPERMISDFVLTKDGQLVFFRGEITNFAKLRSLVDHLRKRTEEAQQLHH
jgi:hypothetical protein